MNFLTVLFLQLLLQGFIAKINSGNLRRSNQSEDLKQQPNLKKLRKAKHEFSDEEIAIEIMMHPKKYGRHPWQNFAPDGVPNPESDQDVIDEVRKKFFSN